MLLSAIQSLSPAMALVLLNAMWGKTSETVSAESDSGTYIVKEEYR